MKKTNSLPSNQSDDELRRENEELREKLEKDFGMRGFGSGLSPKLENAWLKSIHEFEKVYQEEEKDKMRKSLSQN